MVLQEEQAQLRESMSRSWGAAGASPGSSRGGMLMAALSSWCAFPTANVESDCAQGLSGQGRCFETLLGACVALDAFDKVWGLGPGQRHRQP